MREGLCDAFTSWGFNRRGCQTGLCEIVFSWVFSGDWEMVLC